MRRSPLLILILLAGCRTFDSSSATRSCLSESLSGPPQCSPNADRPPLSAARELSVDLVVDQVLASNPSLAQMTAAWQAAAARYPQVTSLDDPMFGTMIAPASIGSNNVDFGYRVEISQKLPWPGKRELRG